MAPAGGLLSCTTSGRLAIRPGSADSLPAVVTFCEQALGFDFTPQEEQDLAAFLNALQDAHTPTRRPWAHPQPRRNCALLAA